LLAELHVTSDVSTTLLTKKYHPYGFMQNLIRIAGEPENLSAAVDV
jgi:hypothetical protein